nr:protein TPR2-like isoform X2 [Ipomoea batatas]
MKVAGKLESEKESTDFAELTNKEPWLSSTKLVVKRDMLFGKRGKSGLVEAKYFALEWLGTPGAVTMSSLSRELVFLILQFLDEEKFKETVHKLEQESGFYFNMKYFEDQVQAGEWDEVERYLSGFTKVEDNRYSMKIFFEIRKQKYLEALDKQDRVKAVDILIKDLKVFSSFNEDLFKEITQLLTLDNFRQNEQLSKYGDTKSARNIMLVELKKLIEANPLFRDKLTFPSFKASRLRTLINQSLNWQHQLCKNPRPNPDIKTLFTDHTCASTNGARPPPPSNTPLAGPVPKPGAFPPLGVHSPFQPVVSPSPSAIAGWMTSASPAIPHAAVAPGPPGIVQPPGAAAFLKHPRTPPGVPGMDYQTADSEHLIKRNSSWPNRMRLIAHIGGVNEYCFCLSEQATLHSHVWDAVAGRRQYMFEGHEAPVYSVCPHYKENIQAISLKLDYCCCYSSSPLQIDGKIKAWLYDCMGSRVDYDAPGLWCTTMAYSADGTRTMLRISCFSPRLRFNKVVGRVIAGCYKLVTMESRSLANNDGQTHAKDPQISGSLGPIPNVPGPITPILDRGDRIQQSMSIGNLATMESNRIPDVKPRTADIADKVKSWKFPDITEPSQLKSLRLPDPLTASKVVRLLFTNSGLALLALGSNAVHKLWKWQRNERNPSGKSSASIVPQLWQPSSGALMSNDSSDAKSAEEPAACIALSKNDSYVMSASGGKVSLFNMMTFKVMTTFMPPPPAATYLAFHPQDNNIIAVGMEDSTIQIYNVRVDEVKTKLKGHQKRITGLAFSQSLNVLVSSGADAQLCIWNIDGWEKKKARLVQAPPGHPTPLVGEARVQFHNDQSHILVVHESQIAIYDTQLECLRSMDGIEEDIGHKVLGTDGRAFDGARRSRYECPAGLEKLELFQWYPRDSLSAPISSAIYSCDGMLVFAGFSDGAIGIFDADSFRLRCQIAASAYISSSIGSSSGSAFPVVIAAHPSDANQFALGMNDGSVNVIEPSDAEPKWGSSTSQDNGSLPSIPSSSALNSQPSETASR